MPELKAVIEGLAGAMAIMALVVMGAALVVFAQAASPRGTATPAEIERPQPSAKPTKNPTAMHHHYDRRHPHKGQKPAQKQDG